MKWDAIEYAIRNPGRVTRLVLHGGYARGWRISTDQADIARAWKHILGKVSSYADLEPSLLGRVEELIDFVTGPDTP